MNVRNVCVEISHSTLDNKEWTQRNSNLQINKQLAVQIQMYKAVLLKAYMHTMYMSIIQQGQTTQITSTCTCSLPPPTLSPLSLSPLSYILNLTQTIMLQWTIIFFTSSGIHMYLSPQEENLHVLKIWLLQVVLHKHTGPSTHYIMSLQPHIPTALA